MSRQIQDEQQRLNSMMERLRQAQQNLEASGARTRTASSDGSWRTGRRPRRRTPRGGMRGGGAPGMGGPQGPRRAEDRLTEIEHKLDTVLTELQALRREAAPWRREGWQRLWWWRGRRCWFRCSRHAGMMGPGGGVLPVMPGPGAAAAPESVRPGRPGAAGGPGGFPGGGSGGGEAFPGAPGGCRRADRVRVQGRWCGR